MTAARWTCRVNGCSMRGYYSPGLPSFWRVHWVACHAPVSYRIGRSPVGSIYDRTGL